MLYHDKLVAQHVAGHRVLVADSHAQLWIVDMEAGTAKRVALDELDEQEPITRFDGTCLSDVAAER